MKRLRSQPTTPLSQKRALPPVGRPQNPLCSRPVAAKEHHMPEPTKSPGNDAPAVIEDQAIRQRIKGLTSQILQEGRVDPDAVRDVVRAMIGGTPDNAAASGVEARELFADA